MLFSGPLLEHLSATADVIWWSTLAISALFLLACHLIPEEVAPLQSMPWTFQWRRNLDLDFQSITYAAYHTNGLSRGSHLTLGLEAVAWFTLIASVHWTLNLALLLVLGLQAFNLREPRFAMFLTLTWTLLVTIGDALSMTSLMGLGWRLPAWFLMACGIFRTLGHALENIPPLIATREDRFVPLNEMPNPAKLVLTLPAGYISEFVSALPPRLFIVQVFCFFQWLGYRPVKALPWTEACKLGDRIGVEGWKAYPPVADLIEPLIEDPACQATNEVRHAY